MALEDLTKQIQEKVGSSADGVYGKNTALAIIKSLDFSTSDLTKIIQKKVDRLSEKYRLIKKNREFEQGL